jgi:CRISPR-associated protein Cas1
MKKLLNTLYIMTKESYLTLDGENIVVSVDKIEKARLPLHTLESINCFNYAGASPALMGACASRDIDLCFYTPSGKFLARIVGEERGNVLLRKKQHLISLDEEESCKYARQFILGKIYNARWVLERATRDHSLRVPVEAMKEASHKLANALPIVRDTTELSRLRGIEGEAAQVYFSQFDSLILQQKTEFRFSGRSKRPPTDNVNALLSFAYTILANNCAAALQSVGLDPYVGFLHRLRPGRNSLALDLMEELRPIMADRFAISCINKRLITAKHFDVQESGAVWLNEDGRKAFFKAWQERKQENITHPFLKERVPWGLVPYTQALLLARSLRGDLDDYPPFLWK